MIINRPNKHHAQQHESRNKTTSFFSYSIFTNFGKISCFSLYKGSLGDWGKLGYELATVLNSIFCYKLHPLELCSLATNGTQERTPDGEPPAVLWPIIGCKGNHSISIKQIYSYIFLPSLLSVSAITVASYMAPARKVRIRLRPITQYLWCIAHIGYAHMSFLNSSGSGSIPWYSLGNSEDVR